MMKVPNRFEIYPLHSIRYITYKKRYIKKLDVRGIGLTAFIHTESILYIVQLIRKFKN